MTRRRSGAQFPFFTGTKVRILTQNALVEARAHSHWSHQARCDPRLHVWECCECVCVCVLVSCCCCWHSQCRPSVLVTTSCGYSAACGVRLLLLTWDTHTIFLCILPRVPPTTTIFLSVTPESDTCSTTPRPKTSADVATWKSVFVVHQKKLFVFSLIHGVYGTEIPERHTVETRGETRDQKISMMNRF
jgi:hypothetical protein